MPVLRRLILLLVLVPAGCGGTVDGESAGATTPAAEWRLAGPIEEIGVMEGDAALELHDVTDAVRLPDGRVVVLDAGSAELRMYDSDGVFLLRAGGRGEGPGEFRRPARIRLEGGDVVRVEDPLLRRSTWFDTALRFQSDEPWRESEDPFPREVWLYGRNVVEGPQAPALRAPVRRALDALPVPGPGELRRVVVDGQWRLWLRDELADPAAATRWRVHDMNGGTLAEVELPAALRPTQFGRDFVVGVARDSLGIERVRVYALEGAPETATTPAGPDTDGEDEPPAAYPSTAGRAEPRLADALRRIQAAQERYYSRPDGDFRYAGAVDQLELDAAPPDGLELHILQAGARGYTIVAFDPRDGVACGLTIGVGGPIGWPPGRVLCT